MVRVAALVRVICCFSKRTHTFTDYVPRSMDIRPTTLHGDRCRRPTLNTGRACSCARVPCSHSPLSPTTRPSSGCGVCLSVPVLCHYCLCIALLICTMPYTDTHTIYHTSTQPRRTCRRSPPNTLHRRANVWSRRACSRTRARPPCSTRPRSNWWPQYLLHDGQVLRRDQWDCMATTIMDRDNKRRPLNTNIDYWPHCLIHDAHAHAHHHPSVC